MSQRFTGKAASAATASEKARLPQNSIVPNPASIAPGMTSIMASSTIYIIVMDAVSATSASFTAEPASHGVQKRQQVSA